MLWLVLGISMFIPMGFSFYYRESDAMAIGIAAVVTIIGGLVTARFTGVHGELRPRDGFAVVTFGWISMSIFGMLPFLISAQIPSLTDAFFETMSGFTTTGASILTNIEGLSHGALLWRSMTQWFGGMGIIVLSVAILPMLGIGGAQLFKAEAPGPAIDKLTPRIAETAKLLWGVYIILSVLEVALLMAGNVPFFESLCHTFTTMATGGFSTKNASVGHFQSAYVDYIITLFMFLAGINFTLHYRGFRGDLASYWRDTEFRYFIGIILLVTVIIMGDIYLYHNAESIESAFRQAIFQTVSIGTTTGFGTADYEQWPAASQILLLLLMFIGGCAGSTGGGMKVVRVVTVIKNSILEIRRSIHPSAVLKIKVKGQILSDNLIFNIQGFFLLYIGCFILGTLLMSFIGLDFMTSIGSAAACIGNIGPGLGGVGPTDNYAFIPPVGKWILSFLMLLGRLELYTVLVIFSKGFWKI